MTARTLILCFVAILLTGLPVVAQDSGDGTGSASATSEAAQGGADYGMGLGLGVQSFTDPDSGDTETYQSLSLRPDFAIGKFGIGLDVTLNYRFTGGESGNEFQVREEDWVPDDDTNFFELYLPKIQYLRWGRKGDPLYVQAGGLNNATLGNGFIVGGYSNAQFLPNRRIFGLAFDMDGKLFDFPYVGVETFAANLAAFDVMGGRLYTRPLVPTEIAVLEDLQIGTTFVADTQPFYHASKDPTYTGPANADNDVLMWGVDFRQPILSNPAISLAVFGDYVRQDEANGAMLGTGGRLVRFITYGAQLRFIGENFIPTYFDSTYDLSRVEQYAIYTSEQTVVKQHMGWLASAGFSLLQDRLVFNTTMEGPIGTDSGTYPKLRSSFRLEQGIVPGVSLQANYTKRRLEEPADVFSAENAVIGAQVNYQTGPAVISLIYDLEYDPYAQDDSPWDVTSRLETSISLF